MSNSRRLLVGTTVVISIFFIAALIAEIIALTLDFASPDLTADPIIILLSVAAILIFRNTVNYRIALPKPGAAFWAFFFGVLSTIIGNLPITLLFPDPEMDTQIEELFLAQGPLQLLLTAVLLGSITEELLFRGFFMNIISPLKVRYLSIFNTRISAPVIISAFLFSLSHLGVLAMGAGIHLAANLLVGAFATGLVAGYFQEKHDNNAYAIIAHMSANLPPFLGSLVLQAG